jgi:hypothetical protein
MKQDVMSCSAKAPMCPCYKALAEKKGAESFAADYDGRDLVNNDYIDMDLNVNGQFAYRQYTHIPKNGDEGRVFYCISQFEIPIEEFLKRNKKYIKTTRIKEEDYEEIEVDTEWRPKGSVYADAESFSAEKEKRSKYMEFIYDMFYTPGSDAYKIREERVLPRNDSTYRLASQVGIAFDKRQRPFDSVLHNNLKGLSMGGGNTYYYIIPYKGELFVFSYIVKGRGKNKRGYHTYYTPDSQYGEEQICGIETKHGDDCYCYRKNYKAESFEPHRDSKGRFSEKPLLTGSVVGGLALGLIYLMRGK